MSIEYLYSYVYCTHSCCCMNAFFFFFKQNTAYEMRISDWSSDVCSSDLERRRRNGGSRCRLHAHPRRFPCDSHLQPRAQDRPRRRDRDQDRKSVVEGKSVSIRVDLGGGRNVKKKKNKPIGVD